MSKAQNECPAPAAHRRLMDCHVHWHALAERYMDPEGFRLQLNALIQDLRNVTWVLQKQKAQLPDFDDWYEAWKESVNDDAVMQWLVKARNRIVKEADLEIYSQARIMFSADWLSGYRTTMVMPPRFSTHQILSSFMATRPSDMRSGLVTVERRWVENRLQNWEILEATAHVYDQLIVVINLAHIHAGVDTCSLPPRDRPCVTAEIKRALLCMRVTDAERRLDLDLAENQAIVEKYVKLEDKDPTGAAARERYGTVRISSDAIERVPQTVEMAKAMLAADKQLMTVAWLLKGERGIDVYPLSFYKQTSKRVAMEKLANHIQRIDADGAVLIGEAWMATPEPGEDLRDPNIPRPADRPNRREVITIEGITRDGRSTNTIVFFSRNSTGEIVFEETFTDIRVQSNMVVPILRKWEEG